MKVYNSKTEKIMLEQEAKKIQKKEIEKREKKGRKNARLKLEEVLKEKV